MKNLTKLHGTIINIPFLKRFLGRGSKLYLLVFGIVCLFILAFAGTCLADDIIQPQPSKLYAINPDGTEKWNFEMEGRTLLWSPPNPMIGPSGTIYVTVTNSEIPWADNPWIIPYWKNGIYAINPDGTLKWFFSTENNIYLVTTGQDGTVYSSVGELWAISPDGTKNWSFDTGGFVYPRYLAMVIEPDGTIYVSSYDNNLYAINPDGTEKWSISFENYIAPPRLGPDGTIYVSVNDGNLYAINPDGTEKWVFETTEHVLYPHSPTVGPDGKIYVSWDNLHVVNPNGTENWLNTEFSVYGNVLVDSDGIVYFGSLDNNLYALNPNWTERWSFKTSGVVTDFIMGPDGTIYALSADVVMGPDWTIYEMSYKLYAIDQGGTEKWSLDMGWDSYSLDTGAEGNIYCYQYNAHTLYAVDNRGTIKWTFSDVTNSPAISSDGTVYVISDGGGISTNSGDLSSNLWYIVLPILAAIGIVLIIVLRRVKG